MISYNDTDHGEIDLMKGLIAGMAGGLLAYVSDGAIPGRMEQRGGSSLVRKKRGGRKPDPTTVKAANAIAEKVTGRKVPTDYKPLAGEVVHYGVGAGSAAVYGLLAEVAPLVTVANGAAFGAGMWLLADEVAVPAAGLSKSPKEIPLTTHLYALVSHLVYGWVTETVRRAVRQAL